MYAGFGRGPLCGAGDVIALLCEAWNFGRKLSDIFVCTSWLGIDQ